MRYEVTSVLHGYHRVRALPLNILALQLLVISAYVMSVTNVVHPGLKCYHVPHESTLRMVFEKKVKSSSTLARNHVGTMIGDVREGWNKNKWLVVKEERRCIHRERRRHRDMSETRGERQISKLYKWLHALKTAVGKVVLEGKEVRPGKCVRRVVNLCWCNCAHS